MTDLPALTTPAEEPGASTGARWRFLRDVAVFEAKLALNNLHNFFQVPLTLGVAAMDLVLKGDVEGGRFYKVVEMGRTIDSSIDIYSVIAHRESSLNKDYTVDAIVARLETVIVREYQRGGTAATVKQAVDHAIDELQSKTGEHASKAGDAIKAAVEKILHGSAGKP